ncbi:MAG: hypothetical protein AB1445_12015 [Bacillota bacterium]
MVACLLVVLVAVALTARAFDQWLASYRSLQEVAIRLVSLRTQGLEIGVYEVVLRVENGGELPLALDDALVLLKWDQRLVASLALHPEAVVIPSRSHQDFQLVLESNLGRELLPEAGEGDPGWSIRVTLALRYPPQRRVFRITLEGRTAP